VADSEKSVAAEQAKAVKAEEKAEKAKTARVRLIPKMPYDEAFVYEDNRVTVEGLDVEPELADKIVASAGSLGLWVVREDVDA
jgi:hypothetical protein